MPGKRKKWQALLQALQQNDGEGLDARLKANGGFDFTGRTMKEWNERRYDEQDAGNREQALQLVNEAYKLPDPSAVLAVLYKNRKNLLYKDRKDNFPGQTCYLFPADLLRAETPKEMLDVFLKENPRGNFSDCLARTGVPAPDTDKLEFILSFASAENARALDNALVAVAAAGDNYKAALLLQHGANPGADNAAALSAAAETGHGEMVDLLLPFVSFDSEGVVGEKVFASLKYKAPGSAILQSIEAAVQKSARKAPVETAPAPQEEDRFRRRGADILEEVQALPDGWTLTTQFNFSSQQQKNIMTNSAPNSTPTIETISFDKLGDGVVTAMRQKLDALAAPAAVDTADETAKRLKRFQNVIK